jgi:hypothetical protein
VQQDVRRWFLDTRCRAMKTFDPTAYGPTIAALLREDRLAPLGPGTPNRSVRTALEAATTEKLFGDQRVHDRHMADACRAGLWLYHDFLDESHTISQDIDTPTGSYWHGLMHRREPDFSNSKYWFRRVGTHPVFEPLLVAASELTSDPPAAARFLTTEAAWDPFAFVDLCEQSLAGRAPCAALCQQVQRQEWQLLFDHCYRKALGA